MLYCSTRCTLGYSGLQACSDDGEHDSDQDMRTGRQQACPDLPIQASHDVRSRKIVVPQNTNDWTGRASIAADDVLVSRMTH